MLFSCLFSFFPSLSQGNEFKPSFLISLPLGITSEQSKDVTRTSIVACRLDMVTILSLSLSPSGLFISQLWAFTLSVNQNQIVSQFRSAGRAVMVGICSLSLCCCHFSAKSPPPSSVPPIHLQLIISSAPGRAHQSIPHHVLIFSHSIHLISIASV